MNERTLEWVVFGSGVLVVLSFWINVYVKYSILPEVERRLQNCAIVADSKARWGNSGFLGRSHRLVMVNLALTSTSLLHRKGMVDIDEISHISVAHRRWICIPMNLALAGFIGGFGGLALLGKLW